MATTYKVLGQSNPAATTLTTLYTVPASTQTVVSTITVANQAASAATYRISVRPDGAAQANQHYIAFDAPIAALDTVALSLGITLGNTDVISVYSANANLSFSVFGTEIT